MRHDRFKPGAAADAMRAALDFGKRYSPTQGVWPKVPDDGILGVVPVAATGSSPTSALRNSTGD